MIAELCAPNSIYTSTPLYLFTLTLIMRLDLATFQPSDSENIENDYGKQDDDQPEVRHFESHPHLYQLHCYHYPFQRCKG